MANYTFPQYKSERPAIGSFFSWWLSANPKDGTARAYTDRRWGEQFSINHVMSPDGKYRSGGPWISVRRTVSTAGSFSRTFVTGNRTCYVGLYVYTSSFDTDWSSLTTDPSKEYTENALMTYGAQAYRALRPDLPDFSPLVALAELLGEGASVLKLRIQEFRKDWLKEIRRLEKKNKCILSKAGRYHLAIQFGWMPILQDSIKFLKAYRNANKRYNQLLKDEGKWIRRRRVLEKIGNDKDEFSETTSTVHTDSYNHPSMYPVHVTGAYHGTKKPTTQSSVHESTFVWAEGASKYALPSGARDDKWFKSIRRRIYSDTTITPDVVYNLIPFSWFVDYFISLGNLMAALSNDGISERFVFKYAYVMRHKVKTFKVRGTQWVACSKNGYNEVSATRLRTIELKSRSAANRFGWGINEGDLSPTQLGILGALGASKL